jgi:hypothetical protein
MSEKNELLALALAAKQLAEEVRPTHPGLAIQMSTCWAVCHLLAQHGEAEVVEYVQKAIERVRVVAKGEG